MSEVQTAAVAKAKLTGQALADKYRADAATLISKANAIEAGLAAEAALANIGAGAIVSFEFGRAETRHSVTGSVIAAYDKDGKRYVKVIAGEGVDTKLYEVEVSKLSVPAATEAEAEQPASTDGQGVIGNPSGADEDPLANLQ